MFPGKDFAHGHRYSEHNNRQSEGVTEDIGHEGEVWHSGDWKSEKKKHCTVKPAPISRHFYNHDLFFNLYFCYFRHQFLMANNTINTKNI